MHRPSTTPFTVNGRTYAPPARPVAVICLDGSADDYLDATVARGRMPNLIRMSLGGARGLPLSQRRPNGPVRYAVVGLGHIAQVAVLPAFAHARRNSQLAALVSDDPRKLDALAHRYRVPTSVSYADYDALLDSGQIDAVYVALPNSQHRDYAERALRAGIHVLCEKPMAVTRAECAAMLDAAQRGQCSRAKVGGG